MRYRAAMLVTLLLLAARGFAESGPVVVGTHRGAPALFVDGQPEFPMLFYQTVLTDNQPAQMRDAGFRVFSFVGADGVFGMSIGWTGDNQYDYHDVDAALEYFAARVPDGYCIPRILVSAPAWWLDAHPEETVRFANGATWQENGWGGTKHESFASQRWRTEAGEVLRRFVRHMCDSPYANRVAGLHIAGGIYGEWHNWSAPDLPDTSEPMRQAYIRYVRDKYHRDVTALPTQTDQTHSDVGMFRDPVTRRDLIAYDESLHAVTLDAIEHFCRIVKEESKGRLLTMALYSYTPDLDWPQAGDHRAGPEALRSSAIDILASPHTYSRRRLGEDGLFRHFPAAVALHGKLFLDEADDRTCGTPESWPARYAPNVAASRQIIRREFANALARGAGLYYMDQSGTFFDDPALIDELATVRKWADRAMDVPRESVAQVAVISSLKSEFYLADRSAGLNHVSQGLYDVQIGALCRSGAPFDWYHIEDLVEGLIRPYRAYIFLDAFHVTDAQRRAIDKLKSEKCTLMWFYAPGFATDEGLSLDSMRDLTGFKFDRLDQGTLQLVADPQFLPDVHGEMGIASSQSPVFVPHAPRMQVWARTKDTLQPALTVLNQHNWRSVYASTPGIPASVLRRLFATAGVHIYCDSNDNLSANASWISLHAATAGDKTIRLPSAAPVYDIFAKRLISPRTVEFTTTMKAGHTAIWMLANPK